MRSSNEFGKIFAMIMLRPHLAASISPRSVVERDHRADLLIEAGHVDLRKAVSTYHRVSLVSTRHPNVMKNASGMLPT